MRIILITGGQRSGKSEYAERLALSLSSNPVYLATSRVWDEDFRQRILKHQQRRGPQWTNIEEEKHLSHHNLAGRTILIDCITLWLTNIFFDVSSEENIEGQDVVSRSLEFAKKEFDTFTENDATYIFVTNEIGLGGTSTDAVQRRFTDLQGWFNQYVGNAADEIYLLVCGHPIKVK